MSRFMRFCLFACALHCGHAKRIHSQNSVQKRMVWGVTASKEAQAKCIEEHPLSTEEDEETLATCFCHAASGHGKSACASMTVMSFRSGLTWGCGVFNEGKPDETCEPMYPGGNRIRHKPAKSPVIKTPFSIPQVVVEEKVTRNLKSHEDVLEEDWEEELEELEDDDFDLEEENPVDIEDRKPGDTTEKTAQDEEGQIKYCELITSVGERASCICDLANSATAQADKCTHLAEIVSKTTSNTAAPWSCAVHAGRKKTCAPIAPVAPPPKKEAPKPKDEPKPQPKDCNDNVEDATWWRNHKDYYSALFDVADEKELDWELGGMDYYAALHKVEEKNGGHKKKLMCKFEGKDNDCLNTVHESKKGHIQVVRTLAKQKGINIKCGSDGKWKEPSEAERQSCAYPIVPKNLKRQSAAKGKVIDAGEKVNRVLTAEGDSAKVINWDGGYNLNQLWVMMPDGLIRSLGKKGKCLSAVDPANLILGKPNLLEAYLFLHDCEKNGIPNEKHVWWLGPDMAPFVRRTQAAQACGTANSCCSLSFAKSSQGFFFGHATGGKNYMTFPQIERTVHDYKSKKYIWRSDGSIELLLEVGHVKPVGLRSAGDGSVSKPTGSEVDSQIMEKFTVVAENRPKVLSWSKMSKEDSMLTVLEFWKL